MNDERDALRHFAERTAPSDGSVDRVRERLLAGGHVRDPDFDHAGGLLAVYRAVTWPLGNAADRVAARVRFSLALLRVQRTGWAVGFAAAAAAAALWLAPWPAAELSAALVAESVASLAPTEHVELRFQGKGELSGTPAAPRVDWRGGELRVAVEPQQGVDFQVNTPEATVRVVGTVFSVTRDQLGSRADVERGTVEVTCTGSEPVLLTAGQSRLCLPTTPAGLLARGRALSAAGLHADADEALRAGLASVEPASPVRRELAYARANALAAADRGAEALAVLGKLIEDGAGHREAAAVELAARLALQRGCSEANRWLQLLPQDHELRERCR